MSTDNDDRRSNDRLEPSFAEVTIIPEEGGEGRSIVGTVLDASENGLAVQKSRRSENGDANIREGEIVKVFAKATTASVKGDLVGDAKVLRPWDDGKTSGLALYLPDGVSNKTRGIVLSGVRHNVRVENQRELATVDINKMHKHVQYLYDCQLKLFLAVLTVGAVLGTCYLTLAYHSSVLAGTNDISGAAELSVWRLWIAALPALLSVVVAAMVTQKIAAIARDESFLAVLKDCRISGNYPREYRGWEDAYRKLKYVWHSSYCRNCAHGECGAAGPEKKSSRWDTFRPLFRPNVFNFLLFSILGAIIGFSLLAVTGEILSAKAGLGNDKVFLIGAILGGIVIAVLLVLGFFILLIHRGRYSFAMRRKVWTDILNCCPYHP